MQKELFGTIPVNPPAQPSKRDTKRARTLLVASALAALVLTQASRASAIVQLDFDFENASINSLEADPSIAYPGITGKFISPRMGVQNLEFLGSDKAMFGNILSPTSYPKLTLSLLQPMLLDSISFGHLSNHNNIATMPSYLVNVLFGRGSTFSSLGSFVAQPSGGYISRQLVGPGLVAAGNYELRLIPNVNPSTYTDWIGFNRFTLNFSPVPGPLPALGAGIAYGFSRRLRRRLKAKDQTSRDHSLAAPSA